MANALFLIFGGAAAVVVLRVGLRMIKRGIKRKALQAKYGDTELVNDLMSGTIRMGMTAQHVHDSWGRPAAIDEKTYKTKTVLTYKYGHVRSNQFRSRVKLEDGVVVGWEQK